jgi:hypothetical protein
MGRISKLPKFTKVVSLGNWCAVANYLKIRELRTESYPFDWAFSTLKTIQLSIEDDFKAFFGQKQCK